jgi:S-adenosylmethionine hydrolase
VPRAYHSAMSIITLLTDFGTDSPYVAAMKGVMLSINPAATIVDLTHAIPPQDVREAALVWEEVAGRFPPGTVHVAVIDPGVGSERALVCARIGHQWFVCPDNGLLSRLTQNTWPTSVFRLEDPEYWLHPVSATFHGRDIMAPVAARLTLGLDPSRLGPPHANLVTLDWPTPVLLPGRIEGHVLRIDSFGNVITDIPAAMLADAPVERLHVVCNGQPSEAHVRCYAHGRPGVVVSLIGSSDRLELALARGRAADYLHANVGDAVTARW